MNIEMVGLVGIGLVGFFIGRAFQKWSDGMMDWENEVFEAGVKEGLERRNK